MKHNVLRQILSIALVIMMLVPNFALPSFAEEESAEKTDPYWSLSDAEGIQGATVTIKLTLNNAVAHTEGSIAIDYNHDYLELVSIDHGKDMPNGTTILRSQVNTDQLTYAFMKYADDGKTPVDTDLPQSAELLHIQFRIKTDAPDGWTGVRVMLIGEGLTKADGSSVQLDAPEAGTVKVGLPSGDPVAKLSNGSKYTSLQATINAADNVDTIYLLSDTYLGDDAANNYVYIPADKKITLDLGEYTISGRTVNSGTNEKFGIVRNLGELTIKSGENGAINAIKISTDDSKAPSVSNGGTLTILGGTYSGLASHVGSKTYIEGGTFTGTSSIAYGTFVLTRDEETSKWKADTSNHELCKDTYTRINGGVFKNTLNVHAGEFELNDGTFKQLKFGKCLKSAVINGGTVYNSSSGSIANSSAAIVLEGDTTAQRANNAGADTFYKVTINAGRMISNGPTAILWGAGNLDINGGYIESAPAAATNYTTHYYSPATIAFSHETYKKLIEAPSKTLNITGGEIVNSGSGNVLYVYHNNSYTHYVSTPTKGDVQSGDNTIGGTYYNISGGKLIANNGAAIMHVTTPEEQTICAKSPTIVINPVAPELNITGGFFKTAGNYAVVGSCSSATDINSTNEQVASYLGAGYVLSPGTDGWSRAMKPFEMSIEADTSTHYNVGDTVLVTIYAAPENGVIRDYQFKLNYDSAKLDFVDVTSAFQFESQAQNAGAYSCVLKTGGVKIYAAKMAVATAKFTVKDAVGAVDSDTISLSDVQIGDVHGLFEPTTNVVGEAQKVNLHNIVVTLNTDEHSKINGSDNLTLYAKYNAAGLYSDHYTNAAALTTSADTGYDVVGWSDGTTTYTTEQLKAMKFTENKTFTLTSAAKQFDFAIEQNTAYTVDVISGVTENKATYAQDIKFTVTQTSANNPVRNVYYNVGTAKTIVTADANGVYTIPGTAILGNITVGAETNKVIKLTFKAGEGIDLADTIRYTTQGGSTQLYSDVQCTTPADPPTPAAQSGYRLPHDDAAEPMWKTAGGAGYTQDSVKTAALTEDTVLTVSGIKVYEISFVAGEHGTLGFETTTVDAGTAVSNITMPQVTVNEGYKHTGWTWTPNNTTVSSNMTATATYELLTWKYTPPASDEYTVTVTGATKDADGNYTMTYGDDITISVTAKPGYALNTVTVKNGENNVPAVDGKYSFTVTGEPTVSVTTDKTVTVSASAGVGGRVTPSSIAVVIGSTKADAERQLTATPAAGYEFSHWQWSTTGETISEACTVQAVFTPKTYKLYINGEEKGTVTCGTDYTINKLGENSTVVISAAAKVGGTQLTLSRDENNNYVVNGSSIIGDLYITTETLKANVIIVDGSYFGAAPAGKNIAVLVADKLDGNKYSFVDGSEFFWSENYKAYVRFVDAGMTEEGVMRNLAKMTGDATSIVYNGDVSLNSSVTSVDAGIVNDVLHNGLTIGISDLMRFSMDVSNAKPSDGEVVVNGQYMQITTSDIAQILSNATQA